MHIALRLALAHHPVCSYFEHERVGPFCRGCITTWPAFFLAAPVWFLAPWGALATIIAGAALGVPYLVGSWLPVPSWLRVLRMALGGVGLSGLVVGLVGAPWPLVERLLALGAVSMLLAVLQAWRVLRWRRTCRTCPWEGEWGHCPGFNEVP